MFAQFYFFSDSDRDQDDSHAFSHTRDPAVSMPHYTDKPNIVMSVVAGFFGFFFNYYSYLLCFLSSASKSLKCPSGLTIATILTLFPIQG